MGLFLPAIWLLSGVTLCAGLAGFTYHRKGSHHPFLPFGVLAVLVGIDLMLMGEFYAADSLARLRGLFETRFVLSFAIFTTAVWFIGAYTRLTHLRTWLALCSAAYLVLFVTFVSSSGTLFLKHWSLLPPTVFAGSTLHAVNATLGPMWIGYRVTSLAVFVWCLWRCVAMWRARLRYKVWPLLGYFLLQFGALLYDSHNSLHGTSVVPLAQFAFLGLVAIMGATLISESRRKEELFYKSLQDLREETVRRERAEARLRRLVYRDPLTNLPNRRVFARLLARAYSRYKKHAELGAIVLLNLDNFKLINESLGHACGDGLLRHVGERLQGALTGKSEVCYLGADEYAIVIPDLGADRTLAEASALEASDRLRQALAGEYDVIGVKLTVGASAGLALFPDPEAMSTDASHTLTQADLAMHHAKSAGRNRASVFARAMRHEAEERLMMETGLRRALKHKELELYFQPQSGANGELLAAEALLRWNHPTLGLIEPTRFISIAEDSGIIHDLGAYALTEACTCLARWQAADLPVPERLSVNVSPWELAAPDYPERVQRILVETQIAPSCITLEITESTALQNTADLGRTIDSLAALGVRFSIDDFGSGYAALSSIKKLKVHELKIDRSFVQGMNLDQPDVFITTILGFAQKARLAVIAEGVENRAQLAALKLLHCQGFQGYLISKPLGEHEFIGWLKLAETRRFLAGARYSLTA